MHLSGNTINNDVVSILTSVADCNVSDLQMKIFVCTVYQLDKVQFDHTVFLVSVSLYISLCRSHPCSFGMDNCYTTSVVMLSFSLFLSFISLSLSLSLSLCLLFQSLFLSLSLSFSFFLSLSLSVSLSPHEHFTSDLCGALRLYASVRLHVVALGCNAVSDILCMAMVCDQVNFRINQW